MPTDPQPQEPVCQVVMGDDGRVYLEVGGDLDITTVTNLADQLAMLKDIWPAALFVDMSGVGFIDCASARLLADAAADLPSGRPLVLTSVGPAVRRLLKLTGLDEMMQIAD